MTRSSMFWEGNSSLGTGVGDVGPYSGDLFAEFLKAIWGEKTGILSGLRVIESTPNAKTVDVEAGKAIVKGRFLVLDADLTLTIANNTSGNARIDYIVAQCDWANQEITLEIVEGTPAASPSAPTLTQNDGTLWQMPLAQITVADAFTTISETEITRERAWATDDWPGRIETSATDDAPNGWLVCDGSAVSRADYADLFDAIGTDFGSGDGSTTFNLPDMRGRVPVGLDNMGGSSANVVTNTNADSVGGTGGEENHTLTNSEMPTHSHQFTMYNGGTGSAKVSSLGLANSAGNITTTTAGGGAAHNNMQPWMAMYWMIKT